MTQHRLMAAFPSVHVKQRLATPDACALQQLLALPLGWVDDLPLRSSSTQPSGQCVAGQLLLCRARTPKSAQQLPVAIHQTVARNSNR